MMEGMVMAGDAGEEREGGNEGDGQQRICDEPVQASARSRQHPEQQPKQNKKARHNSNNNNNQAKQRITLHEMDMKQENNYYYRDTSR